MNPFGLTKREVDIIQLVANGYTNDEVAKYLHLSVGSVKAGLHNVCKKMDVRNRVEAAVLWIIEVHCKKLEDESFLAWMIRVGGPACNDPHCAHQWCGWIHYIRYVRNA